jgi:demethylmenaquinone methyltransferase/2-methoxy-6-polyprenyl-1,4-benzoquinol methylase
MFDAISPRYDLLNRVLSLGIDQHWRRRVIMELRQIGGSNVLDVATGTADLAIMAARNGMNVTGVDISPGMLRHGQVKVDKAGLTDRVRLRVADGTSLPFSDRSFDAVTVAFGVRNFEDLDRGLSEMRRVLTKGGLLCVLEFSRPRGPLAPLYRLYFRRVLPAIGRLVSRDAAAYRYLPASVDAFSEGDAFLAALRHAGFEAPACRRLTGGIASLYLARK